jgi:hypothetical protein
MQMGRPAEFSENARFYATAFAERDAAIADASRTMAFSNSSKENKLSWRIYMASSLPLGFLAWSLENFSK